MQVAFYGKDRNDDDEKVLKRSERSGRVPMYIGIGGSGHEPALSGYVGEGMLDISVPGESLDCAALASMFEAGLECVCKRTKTRELFRFL